MMKTVLFFFVGMLFSAVCSAQDFVYKPINPAFGGDSYNYSWLLSQAEAQNKIKDPDADKKDDPLETFQEDLNRQILYRLSQQIVDEQFGNDGLEVGEYNVGDYNVLVTEGPDGLNVSIRDIVQGSQTSVTVPNQ
jgi:curli production assembly/transport component CsgF